MSKLRTLEEERRRPKEMPFEERERIIELIRRMLEEEPIELAVVHGGFISSRVFRDIDIAIYVNERLDPDSQLVYADELRDRLEKAIGIGVDIQLLNEAPPAFAYRALREGRIVVERRIGMSSIMKIHALEEMRRLKKMMRNADGNRLKADESKLA